MKRRRRGSEPTNGRHVFVDDDGTTRTGSVTANGQLCGDVEERFTDGSVWNGRWRDGARDGAGALHLYDGSRLEGTWVNGVLDGQATFSYPDGGQSQLRGRWVHDAMQGARFFRHGRRTGEEATYSAEADFPGSEPLLCDPYERTYNFVAPSTLPGAGEGLFARRDVPADFLIAYYNGCFVPHTVVDGRSWRYNANTISRDGDYAIDVPKPYDELRRYCATVGHKANHCRELKNARYCNAFHPRWGDVCGVKSTRPLRAGEEVFVDYEYHHARLPPWYAPQ